jgi:transcriptional antiterminator RfaH
MAESLQAPLWETGEATPRWYACYTRARAEKRVAELLADRGVEAFLPLVPRLSQWKDRRTVVEWPMFPSYVFGRFDLRCAHEVLAIPGVTALVRAAGRPLAIPDSEIENVRRFVELLRSGGRDAPELKPRPFERGEWVEVVDGPWQGLRGVVVGNRNRGRVLVGLTAIGQGMEIQIDTRVLRTIPEPGAVEEGSS